MQSLDKPWPCGFKKWHEELGELSLKNSKSVKLYIDGLFLSKTYSVSARKFQRNYVSWHSRMTQNLKKTRLVAWGIILKICLFFMRAVESLEICTLMGFNEGCFNLNEGWLFIGRFKEKMYHEKNGNFII